MRNVVVMLAVATTAFTASCSSDTPPATDEQYCATISTNAQQLSAPAIVDSVGVEATAELYRSITAIAPLAVQSEWQTMTSTVEAAAAIDPSDPAAVQQMADMARSSQHAASTISDYTSKLCGIVIGAPTTTIVAPAVVDTGVSGAP
ncbi:MAG: hypothetical protein ABI894_10995 [Ilumatobacteraceae bacterium]